MKLLAVSREVSKSHRSTFAASCGELDLIEINIDANPQGAIMKDWEPSPEAWNNFLNILDADPDRVGDKYENMHRKLTTFFECRRCLAAESLADTSINRVIRRHFEGEVIKNLMGYVYGVAKIVYLEYLAEQGKEQALRDHLTYVGEPVKEDFDDDDLHVCFDRCMAELPVEDQKFIKQYYEETQRVKINNRKSMGERLGISQNALVLRAFHIRRRLKRCINKCLKRLQR
jgi:DNA-directed RNA polymerase specialized sigma24 family protein